MKEVEAIERWLAEDPERETWAEWVLSTRHGRRLRHAPGRDRAWRLDPPIQGCATTGAAKAVLAAGLAHAVGGAEHIAQARTTDASALARWCTASREWLESTGRLDGVVPVWITAVREGTGDTVLVETVGTADGRSREPVRMRRNPGVDEVAQALAEMDDEDARVDGWSAEHADVVHTDWSAAAAAECVTLGIGIDEWERERLEEWGAPETASAYTHQALCKEVEEAADEARAHAATARWCAERDREIRAADALLTQARRIVKAALGLRRTAQMMSQGHATAPVDSSGRSRRKSIGAMRNKPSATLMSQWFSAFDL